MQPSLSILIAAGTPSATPFEVKSPAGMFRPSGNGFRQRLVGFTLKAALYGSWILGMFPFTYDRWTRKLHRSKWLMGYGLILTTALMVFIHTNNLEAETPAMMEVFHRNPLAEQVNDIHDFHSLAMVVVMVLRSYWKSAAIEEISNELMDLEERHFRHYPSEGCCHFDSFVLYKGLSVVLEVISMLVLEVATSPGFSRQFVVGLASLCLMILAVLLGASHFHLAVLIIYRNMWIINRELLRLANQLAEGIAVESSRVDTLLSLYHRLLELNTRLAAIYDYQMVMVMANFLMANILGIYFYIIYTISLKKGWDYMMVFVMTQTLLINMFDFCLSVAVFDLAERTGRQTSAILKLFNDSEIRDEKLERSITEFALYCSHRRLRFRHCGLFYVNYEMGFRMAVTSFQYLLFLIQFDFYNL